MSKKTFNDVKEFFQKAGYSIEKDPAFTVRRFLVKKGNKEVIPVRYIPTMDELWDELKKVGIDKFISTHTAEARTSGPIVKSTKAKASSRKSSITKSIEELDTTPRALKNRRAQAQTVEYFEAAVVEAPEYVAEHTILSIAGTKLIAPINYERKIPKSHNGYYFPNNIQNIVTRLKLARNIFLQGAAGTGKSELPTHLADLFGAKVVRVNFNVGTTEQHLIGKFVVKDGHTKFVYGLIPLAMKNGWWIILDEVDYAQPEHLSALQSVLEGNSLMITQNENEEIFPHENFRIFATGNTKGRGDESQSYVGTNFLNMAFLDRWSIFEMTYTTAENKICKEIIKDDVLANQIVEYFKLLRKTAEGGELGNVSFSTRRLIQICEVLSIGESLKEALTYELWSRYDEYEVNVMVEASYDIWDRTTYFSKAWKIGDSHETASAAKVEGLLDSETGEVAK